MDGNFNIRKYLIVIGVSILSTVCLLSIICVDTNPLSSLLSESIVFAIATIITSYLIFRDKNIARFFLIAYLIKLIVGVVHYLMFIDPNYFISSGDSMKLHYEFQGVLQTVQNIVAGKKINGVFSFVFPEIIPHEELWNIITIPLFYSGTFILNITPISVFASLFTAMNILLVDKCNYGRGYVQSNALKYIIVYFPVTLISSYYSRDMMGWCLMSVGVVLLNLSRSAFTKVLMLMVSCYLFHLQRNAYVFVPFVMFCADYLFINKNKNLFVKILAIGISAIIIPYTYILFETESNLEYVKESTKWPVYMLPLKFVIGLIGPFPWSNFIKWKTFPEASYYLGDYLMGVLNIGFLITVLRSIPKRSFKKTVDISFVSGIVLFFFGIMNTYMHMSYVAIGIIFMTPWFFRISSDVGIRKNIKIAFLLLVLLNVFVSLTGISGLASDVK